MTNRPSHPKRQMVADTNDPMIGVHTLTEFIFCPRAGLFQYEQQMEDDEEIIEQTPNLEYMPLYDLRAIELQLQKRFKKFWTLLKLLTGVVGLMGVLYFTSWYEIIFRHPLILLFSIFFGLLLIVLIVLFFAVGFFFYTT